MKKVLGMVLALGLVLVLTDVVKAEHPWNRGAACAPGHHPTHHSAYRYSNQHFYRGSDRDCDRPYRHDYRPYRHDYRPPVTSGYRGPLPPAAGYCPDPVPGYGPVVVPPVANRGNFSYQGRHFGFSFGY
ncbi:MAG: hypothetical protein U0935_23030 [Pirellulales bacterium]